MHRLERRVVFDVGIDQDLVRSRSAVLVGQPDLDPALGDLDEFRFYLVLESVDPSEQPLDRLDLTGQASCATTFSKSLLSEAVRLLGLAFRSVETTASYFAPSSDSRTPVTACRDS